MAHTTSALAVIIITRSDGRTSSGFLWAVKPVENLGTLKIAKPYAIILCLLLLFFLYLYNVFDVLYIVS